jgi:HPt (histidine-containing phosphotransfer) domain-containing protein
MLDAAALERLREMSGGDDAFLRELVDTFLADAPGMLAEMRQALAQGDAATFRRAAHSMKSNSRDFGAKALAELCLAMETMGKEGKLEGAMEKLAEAEAEYGQVATALQMLR